MEMRFKNDNLPKITARVNNSQTVVRLCHMVNNLSILVEEKNSVKRLNLMSKFPPALMQYYVI